MQGAQVLSLGQEDPLEKGMATHPSLLAWRISWTEAAVHGVAHSQAALNCSRTLLQRTGVTDCFANCLRGEAGRDYHLVLSLLLFPIRGPKRRVFLLLLS